MWAVPLIIPLGNLKMFKMLWLCVVKVFVEGSLRSVNSLSTASVGSVFEVVECRRYGDDLSR